MAAQWTTPKTWSVNDDLTSPDMNQYMRDNQMWLASPPLGWASKTLAVQVNADTTWQQVTFDTATADEHGMVDVTDNRVAAPSYGVYDITARISWEQNATGTRWLQVRKNSGGSETGGDTIGFVFIDGTTSLLDNVAQIQVPAIMAANDYLELFAYQDSGGNLDIQDDDNRSTMLYMRIASTLTDASYDA